MLVVSGTYKNGIVKLDRRIQAKEPAKVMVTFVDDEMPAHNERLTIKDFSFLKSRKKSTSFKGSLSDAVIEERRSEL